MVVSHSVRELGAEDLAKARGLNDMLAADASPITIASNMGILRTAAMMLGLGLAASAYAAVDANVPQLSEFRDGRWQVVEGPATQQATVESDPQLDVIEQLLASGQYKAAKDRLVPWLRIN